MPFIYEREYVFRCDNIRALYARLTPHDRALLRWDPDDISWRQYWLDVHMRGLEKWIFPNLEEEFKARPKSVYTYRDLSRCSTATTKHHRHRTAMRLLPSPDGEGRELEPQRYTYADLQDMADRTAAHAARARRAAGRQGDAAVGEPARVGHHLLRHPQGGRRGRAGRLAVDAATRCRTCSAGRTRARSSCSDKVRERLERVRCALCGGVEIIRFEELLQARAEGVGGARSCTIRRRTIWRRSSSRRARRAAQGRHAVAPQLHVAVVASWRACSTSTSTTACCRCCRCTTRSSSRRACSCRSCAARRSPTSRRSTPTRSTHAFDEGNITGMVGVPALWQLLQRTHREDRVRARAAGPSASSISDRRPIASCATSMPPALDGLTLLNWASCCSGRCIRSSAGGCACSSPAARRCRTETMKALRGLGFNLYEGYGLTEASPVLTVNRPGTRLLPGTVGEPLPGIDVRIDNPDARGVGEVVASGPERHARLLREPRRDGGGHRPGRLAAHRRPRPLRRRRAPVHRRAQEGDDPRPVGRERLSRRARGALPRLAVRQGAVDRRAAGGERPPARRWPC